MAGRTSLSAVRNGLRTSFTSHRIPALARAFRSFPVLLGPSTTPLLPKSSDHFLADQPSATPFREPTGINPALETASLNSPLHQYGQYLTTCLPKFIQQFSVYKDELTVYIIPSSVVPVLTFLRDHTQCQYKSVMDITAVDYPTRNFRFEVIHP